MSLQTAPATYPDLHVVRQVRDRSHL